MAMLAEVGGSHFPQFGHRVGVRCCAEVRLSFGPVLLEGQAARLRLAQHGPGMMKRGSLQAGLAGYLSSDTGGQSHSQRKARELNAIQNE